MKTILTALLLLIGVAFTKAQEREFTINAFRNPSIGTEFRQDWISFHVGFYTTIVSKNDKGENEATWFIKSGVSLWSSNYHYVSASYVYGLTNKYKNDSGFMVDTGLQATVFKRVKLRLGVALLLSPDHEPKINPTPGIGYSF